jgi:hypothetical protein
MSSLKLLGVMAFLSVTIVMPAKAQPVISEPGYCAFFYPNANCQNKGPGNPYTDPNYHRGTVENGRPWSPGESVGVVQKRPRTQRIDSTAMRTR